MKKPIQLSVLAREMRQRTRSNGRRSRSRRGAGTKRILATRPSEGIAGDWSKPPKEWNAQDALAYYATTYKTKTGREDSELTVAAARRKSVFQLKRLLDVLEDDECPKVYIDFAIDACLHGKGYPSDRVPSVTAICFRSIVLKRWRIGAVGVGSLDAKRRGRDWEEG